MPDARVVVGDWGTTNLRLFLCDHDGRVLDEVSGPGAAAANGRYPLIFEALLAPWQKNHGPLPAVLCGMVGSTIGWTRAPYVPCPVRLEHIADACVELLAGAVHVIPGLACRNRYDAPDFLRGEETQVLGALNLEPDLRRGQHLLCLPGTHTKWVVLRDGAVAEFLSAPTGELFAALRDHSVLVQDRQRDETPIGGAAFDEALSRFDRFPEAQLLHRLFECRARRLAGELAESAAASYLSGLLIASDVAGALRCLGEFAGERTVHIVSSRDLAPVYSAALARQHHASVIIDGSTASLAGLVDVHRHLSQAVALGT